MTGPSLTRKGDQSFGFRDGYDTDLGIGRCQRRVVFGVEHVYARVGGRHDEQGRQDDDTGT